MKVSFEVYDAEERAIVMRAAEEIDALYESRCKDEDREYDGAKVDAAMPYVPPVTVGDIGNVQATLLADISTVVASAGVGPVENFVEAFRKQAQRIGAPAALTILRDKFGVNRATEIPDTHQAMLIAVMQAAPALNA